MEKKLRFGVFGTWRGLSFIRELAKIEEAEVVAICDQDESKIRDAKKHCPANVKVCADFDELIHSGIDVVILANYFNEHAPYAIRAMQAGVDVFSETTAAFTLKECVELVEAVEETGRTYVLAENYPYYGASREITRVYQGGSLGDVVFAEGEYVHPMSDAERKYYTPAGNHWRNGLPRTYYCTHAMAPLMTATGLMPKKVIGKVDKQDQVGIMLVEMENGALFRIAGDCLFGTRGIWYRLGCEKGSVESVRGSYDRVRLSYNTWDYQQDNPTAGPESVYNPAGHPLDDKARSSDHGGADFWVTWNFVQDMIHGRKPFMDVYRAVSISAMAILAWRSALDNSKQLEIPDFTDKAARDRVRDDDMAPMFHMGKEAALPHRMGTVK